MFEIFKREPVMQFDIPQGVSAARIVSTFNGVVADRQFIFTVKQIGVHPEADRKIGDLHWSSSLDCSFEYVDSIQEDTQSLGKKFALPSTGLLLEISCIKWKQVTAHTDANITSLALELFSEEYNFPYPFKQLIIPGEVV